MLYAIDRIRIGQSEGKKWNFRVIPFGFRKWRNCTQQEAKPHFYMKPKYALLFITEFFCFVLYFPPVAFLLFLFRLFWAWIIHLCAAISRLCSESTSAWMTSNSSSNTIIVAVVCVHIYFCFGFVVKEGPTIMHAYNFQLASPSENPSTRKHISKRSHIKVH